MYVFDMYKLYKIIIIIILPIIYVIGNIDIILNTHITIDTSHDTNNNSIYRLFPTLRQI